MLLRTGKPAMTQLRRKRGMRSAANRSNLDLPSLPSCTIFSMTSKFYTFPEVTGKTVKSFKISTAGDREIELGFADGSTLTVSLDLGFTARAKYRGAGMERKKAIKSGPSLRLVQ